MPKPLILAVGFTHANGCQLSPITIGPNGATSVFVSPNQGKTVNKIVYFDFDLAFNYLLSIDPLNIDV